MIVFYFIVAAFAVYVLLPFFDKAYRGKRLILESAELENLSHSVEEILSSINDLEYDFQLKKISEPDYLLLKEKLTLDYITTKKQLDQHKELSGNHAVSADTKKRKPERVSS